MQIHIFFYYLQNEDAVCVIIIEILNNETFEIYFLIYWFTRMINYL